ncbi:hypothetical protein [Proteiniclasticum ruminis]|uniref:Uncharacterized protein n=1 Tax=Proteiniclasticum ruminis TaxID=398199 RepID=A0A1I5E5R3_9CLOT|nr:hypothetical protein [Proteiniclasticum ruminis]SFO06879.1 hypothetical protein SAMN04488695_1149 [Proteiniclasticum ruminis]
MMAYTLGLLVTLMVILFLAMIHVGSKEAYTLNRIYQKEKNGIRLFNRFYLSYLLPWIFLPFIGSIYFRTYYVLYILIFTLALEDGLYLYGLSTGKNKEKFIVMLLFNVLLLGLMYLLILQFLKGFTPFPMN